VASGNDNWDARRESPASAPLVCVVSATNRNDQRASFSNWGPRVDIFAPGEDVVSAVPGGRFESQSGTSMAAPHVAGLAAYLFILERTPPDQMCQRIKNLATRGVIPNPNGSPNLLAYNNVGR
jgi:subtilisin family serine protease